MEITLAPGSKILSASTADAIPSDLKPVLIPTNELLRIEPLLLNPGDSLSLTLVVGGDPGIPNLTARISGIRQVMHLNPIPSRRYVRGLLGAIFGLFAMIMYFYLGGLVGLRSRHLVQLPRKVGLTAAFLTGGVAAFLLLSSARFLELDGWAKAIFVVGLILLVSPTFFLGRVKARQLAQTGTLDVPPIDTA